MLGVNRGNWQPYYHSILLEERTKVYCACVMPALLYAAETWALMESL